MIKIQLIDKITAENNKETIISYLGQVLNMNCIPNKEDDIKKIYNNMINYIEDGSAIIIGAFEEKKLTGFIWAYKVLVNNETRFHINYFIVNEKNRNSGIGKKLMDEICVIAKENNIKKIELMVTTKNEGAINFYKKQNFEVERIKLCKEI